MSETLFAQLSAQDLSAPGLLEAAAQTLLESLTLEEKVAFVGGSTPFWPGLQDMLSGGYYQHPYPGAESARLGVPGMHFIDGPRGVVNGPATCFPVAMARGATWDPALEERVGDAIGVEHRSSGGNLFGGVCVNLLRHPAWGRAQETYGEDPFLLGEMGAAIVRGAQRHVMAVVKHFALNSMENARFKVDVKIGARALHEVYLPHFKRVVQGGVVGVMSAYNSVNGEWCGQSRLLLRGVLKTRWSFAGLVMTDFIFGMRDGVTALQNGQDLEMPFVQQFARTLPAALEAGTLAPDALDDSVLRLLRAQLEQVGRGEPQRYGPGALAQDAHRALAREVAQKSIVLLKNSEVGGVSLLPLEPGSLRRLAVIGVLADTPNTGDRGSSHVNPPYVVTPLEGLRAALPGVEILYDDGADPARAAQAAASADVAVLVVGYTAADEGEYLSPGLSDPAILALFPPPPDPAYLSALSGGSASQTLAGGPRGGDRASLRLKEHDEALIRAVSSANARTVVALEAGSAVMCEDWRGEVGALLMLWYPGMEGGHALADVLLGRVGPGGRLPFSVPTDPAHLPHFDRDAVSVEYDLWHGYRKLERDGNTPAFPFGFGLSYTRFEYRTLTLVQTEISEGDTLEVEVELCNAGTRAGDEVVQLYVSYPASKVERAPRELKAFARVSLAAGETGRVALKVPASSLSYFDEGLDDFVFEQSEYHIRVGSNALDTPLEGRVRGI